jgi:hypothetical protein
MSHANAISVNNSTSLAERVHVGGLVRARAAVEQLHRHVDRRAFEAGPVVRRQLLDAGLVGWPLAMRAELSSRSAWRRRTTVSLDERLKTSRLAGLMSRCTIVDVCRTEAAPQTGKRQRALLVHRLCPAPT